MTSRLLFVVPDMRAAVTGGNLYNLGLTTALRAAGVEVQVVDREASPGGASACFVDSLYLEDLPRLKRALPDATVFLVAHYLPSLVAHGGVPAAAELSELERAALAAADGFLVPSDFMARALAQLAAPRRMIVVAPAVEPPPVGSAIASDSLRAVVVANLVPGKGVLPFLDALAPQLRGGAPLELTIVGSFDGDPGYAAQCRARVAADPILAAAVRFTGALEHAATLRRIASSDLLVSASRMESFGLALAEARALGVPIVAHSGGNAAAMVDEAAGGRLLSSDDALAVECAGLARDRAGLDRRRAAAQAARLRRRSWSDAAAELLAAL